MAGTKTGGGVGTNQHQVKPPGPAPVVHQPAGQAPTAGHAIADPFAVDRHVDALADLRAAADHAGLPEGHPVAALADGKWVFTDARHDTLYDALAADDLPDDVTTRMRRLEPVIDEVHTDINDAYDRVWSQAWEDAVAGGADDERAMAAADDAMDGDPGHVAAGWAAAMVLRRHGIACEDAPGVDHHAATGRSAYVPERWYVPLR